MKTSAKAWGITIAGFLAVTAIGASPAAASRAGASPDTCRTGYVWRGAQNSDHVCVTPAVRDRTARENATGVWHACTQGFVWREAYQGDFRCVVPSSRTQARVDNDAAPYRLAWVIMTRTRHDPDSTSCDGDSCSTTNESSYYTVGVRGYYLTSGARVAVKIVADGATVWSKIVYAGAGKDPGGNYSIDTGNPLCGGGTFAKPYNAYVQVRENSGPWSTRVPIHWKACSNV
ncbi:hypothetical protein [Microbispora sp. H10830]|uniref:hypothetical protein n=1 Tax=Microbispora sp. H10830 TaxID=2729109 RepID=UPI0016015850|nr:hypothetical protein [Microbispora sp. H10830]